MKISARRYSLLMGAGNIGATLVLFGLSRVNMLAGSPNAFVSIMGPLATVAFAVTTIAWFLDALEPGVLRHLIPGQHANKSTSLRSQEDHALIETLNRARNYSAIPLRLMRRLAHPWSR